MEEFRWTALIVDKKPGPFVLTFNSYGGDGAAMFFLLDVLGNLHSPIVTVACCAQSAAAVLWILAGTPGQRYVYPNSLLMLHNGKILLPDAEERYYLDGNLNPRMARLLDARCNINAILARRSTVEYPPSDDEAVRLKSFGHLLDHEQFFSAQEALDFGLADHMMDSETEHRLLLPQPAKGRRGRRAPAVPRDQTT